VTTDYSFETKIQAASGTVFLDRLISVFGAGRLKTADLIGKKKLFGNGGMEK
jgi:hypothetical protein